MSVWVTGSASSPSANDVIVTTGQMAGGTYTMAAILDASLAATFILRLKDHSGNPKNEQEINVLAAAPFSPIAFPVTLSTNDIVEIAMKSSTLGRVSCSISLF